MKENIANAHKLYEDKYSTELLRQIFRRFNLIAQERRHVPILVVMPQLLDLEALENNTGEYISFYQSLCDELYIIDMTEIFKNEDLKSLYINDQYGGHLSSKGNSLVAKELKRKINEIIANRGNKK
jgi:hypothetical protein